MRNAAPDVAPAAREIAPLRRGYLALTLQEALTAVVRLRANKQVAADAESFRNHIKHLLSSAEQDARRAGYAGEDVRLALYAVVVFLDESVLNSAQPMFAHWPRKPLQDEIFGGHTGGEVFFQNVRHLLERADSEDLADVLEVHQLCMLLGFHGRYGAGNTGELHALMSQVSDRTTRIRGGHGALSPAWAPPAGAIGAVARDAWIRRLGILAAGLAAVAFCLFVVYRLWLRSGYTDLHVLAQQVAR